MFGLFSAFVHFKAIEGILIFALVCPGLFAFGTF